MNLSNLEKFILDTGFELRVISGRYGYRYIVSLLPYGYNDFVDLFSDIYCQFTTENGLIDYGVPICGCDNIKDGINYVLKIANNIDIDKLKIVMSKISEKDDESAILKYLRNHSLL